MKTYSSTRASLRTRPCRGEAARGAESARSRQARKSSRDSTTSQAFRRHTHTRGARARARARARASGPPPPVEKAAEEAEGEVAVADPAAPSPPPRRRVAVPVSVWLLYGTRLPPPTLAFISLDVSGRPGSELPTVERVEHRGEVAAHPLTRGRDGGGRRRSRLALVLGAKLLALVEVCTAQTPN